MAEQANCRQRRRAKSPRRGDEFIKAEVETSITSTLQNGSISTSAQMEEPLQDAHRILALFERIQGAHAGTSLELGKTDHWQAILSTSGDILQRTLGTGSFEFFGYDLTALLGSATRGSHFRTDSFNQWNRLAARLTHCGRHTINGMTGNPLGTRRLCVRSLQKNHAARRLHSRHGHPSHSEELIDSLRSADSR